MPKAAPRPAPANPYLNRCSACGAERPPNAERCVGCDELEDPRGVSLEEDAQRRVRVLVGFAMANFLLSDWNGVARCARTVETIAGNLRRGRPSTLEDDGVQLRRATALRRLEAVVARPVFAPGRVADAARDLIDACAGGDGGPADYPVRE